MGSGGSSSVSEFRFSVTLMSGPTIPAAATMVLRDSVGENELADLKASVCDFQEVPSQKTNLALQIEMFSVMFLIFELSIGVLSDNQKYFDLGSTIEANPNVTRNRPNQIR